MNHIDPTDTTSWILADVEVVWKKARFVARSKPKASEDAHEVAGGSLQQFQIQISTSEPKLAVYLRNYLFVVVGCWLLVDEKQATSAEPTKRINQR